jgi:hypothetical protein
MASKTNFLNLILPGNNEYNDTWDEPTNSNFTKIDEEIEVISNEILAARFEKTSLAEFLQVSHFSDGSLRPTPEIADAQNSSVYGSNDDSGNDFELKDRLERGDREIYDAREEASNLLSNLARHSADFDYQDKVIDGAKTAFGQPNFLSSAAAEFKLDGDPTPIIFNIDGHYMMIDQDISVDVTGSDGTKYLVAKRPATPHLNVDKQTEEDGVTTTNALNNDKIQILQDPTQDFSALGLRAGMILTVLNTDNTGEYIIDEVAPSGNVDQILIKGEFVNAIGAINYQISDPLRPEFTVETDYTVEKGKCIIGEGEFLGGALISSLSYNFKGKFESQYTAINVSSTPTFEQIYNHNLGFIPKKIHIFASQADDENSPVEPLSVGDTGNDLSVTINNTLVYSPGTFDPGTTDAIYTPGSLVGDVTGQLDGTIYGLKSVIVKITKTQIFVKNVKDNHFYRDYDNVDRTEGYLKVVCEK